MNAYYARKRSICLQSLLYVTVFAVVLAALAPVLGLALVVGGICGIANMLASMRANERLLDGKSSVGAHAASGVVRIVALGAVPVLTLVRGSPWWALGIYFAGFFTPLVLYALAVRRAYRREG